jgi:hypothetical protein
LSDDRHSAGAAARCSAPPLLRGPPSKQGAGGIESVQPTPPTPPATSPAPAAARAVARGRRTCATATRRRPATGRAAACRRRSRQRCWRGACRRPRRGRGRAAPMGAQARARGGSPRWRHRRRACGTSRSDPWRLATAQGCGSAADSRVGPGRACAAGAQLRDRRTRVPPSPALLRHAPVGQDLLSHVLLLKGAGVEAEELQPGFWIVVEGRFAPHAPLGEIALPNKMCVNGEGMNRCAQAAPTCGPSCPIKISTSL